MLRYALIFLVVAIVAGMFGFTGISLAASDIARFFSLSSSCSLPCRSFLD